MPESIPHLTAASWVVSGDGGITAWFNGDQEFIDIYPNPVHEGLWILYHHNRTTHKTSFLGMYNCIEDAQGAAKTWLGDDEPE